MDSSPLSVLLVTKDLADNSTGRTYVLWLLARHLGWRATVVAPVPGQVWPPVAVDDFIDACTVAAPGDPRLDELASQSDLIIAVKALPGSFGVARALAATHRKPLLLDIDDPDVEAVLSTGHPLKAAAKMVLRAREYWPTRRLRAHIASYPTMVSNPTLAAMYGGEIVPHARFDVGVGLEHERTSPRIVFVGTNRPHKGVDVLRRAAAQVPGGALPLTITDAPPADARPNEEWVGNTTLAEGLDLVAESDIVVIPSVSVNPYASAQLPVKIIDAMLAGRAIATADFDPLIWAAGDGGIAFKEGDAEDLARVLDELRSPELRTRLGAAARERALACFSVDAVAVPFERACRSAVAATH